MTGQASEPVDCELLYHIDRGEERLDRDEPEDSVVVVIERGGWRLLELGHAERRFGDPSRLLAALEEISARHAWVRSGQENRWAPALFRERSAAAPGHHWDGRISSLRVAVHSPGDAPFAEVLAVLSMLGSDGVRAGRQSWWIAEPGGAARRVLVGLTPWLFPEIDQDHSGPVDGLEVEVTALEEEEPRAAGEPRGERWCYSLGPRKTTDRALFVQRLNQLLENIDRVPGRSLRYQLPPALEAAEVVPLLGSSMESGVIELELSTPLPGRLVELVSPGGERERGWWWPRVHE